ncbi:hypothetical protein [Dactylosporangium sp. NPDC048998]|uniref:hypothetical protein n=1 Tax=Dactylosporangium sp. NPDC048998 TaxID=3363976 RepID=UPI00371A160F
MLAALAGLLLLGVLTGGGRETLSQLFGFLVFYCGVFTLVSLTLTVIVGLVATDRIVLVARHRVWVQSVHRTLGIVAISCLGLHIGAELVAGRVGIFGALVPFTTAPFAIGAGSVAAYLMVLVMWTGIVRSRFAQNGRPWLWRPLHAVAYLSWPVAVWHGLNAGRPPAVWVTASYLMLLFLTTIALGLRLSAERGRRRQQLAADRTTTEIAPIGRSRPSGFERRAARSSRFRWDAPPADRMWAEGVAADLRADYRREPAEPAPVTSVPVTSVPVTAVPYDDPEPAPKTYRGSAAVYDDYDPYATYAEPEPAYKEPGMTLRDRFAARRSAAAAEQDRYADDDDTPTLVNLDTRRELRRQERDRREQARQAARQQGGGRRYRADDDDVEYWARLRGEAR